jgi:hypothetical protein
MSVDASGYPAFACIEPSACKVSSPADDVPHYIALQVTPYHRSDGQVKTSVAYTQAGVLLLEGNLQRVQQNGERLLRAIGSQVEVFLNGGGPVPCFARAWTDAAYWGHEAFAEPLDTIAASKLETAIEVLVLSTSTSGSKRRIQQAIGAFYGLMEEDFINPYSQTTVKRFAEELVTDRSSSD